jgi:hypothetical protein
VNSNTWQLATEILGWSDERWQRWLVESLAREIFPNP